jgi:bifunctional non-homologous end joining protein LigD
MLATPADALPQGPEWTYEVKWDGYRTLAVKERGGVQLLSRNDKSLTADYPSIVTAIRALPIDRVVLDGEIVALDEQGRPSFQALQHRSQPGFVRTFYAFDVLSVGTRSLLRQPLARRREELARIVSGSDLRLSETLPGSPEAIERVVRAMGLEGVIAKRTTPSIG